MKTLESLSPKFIQINLMFNVDSPEFATGWKYID